MNLPSIVIVHWRESEAGPLVEAVTAAAHPVELSGSEPPAVLRFIRERQPALVIIDLSRLPAQGREVATDLRRSPKTRHIPLVFYGGLPEKVEAVRAAIPDALFATAETLGSFLGEGLPPAAINAFQPVPMMDRYAGRTAAQKLGFVQNSVVAVLDAPPQYAQIIGDVPEGVVYQEDRKLECSIALWFVTDQRFLESRIGRIAPLANRAKLWLLWPKGGSAAHGQMTEDHVREAGLSAGLVDYKVCSVNERWSALLFAPGKG